jgi:hypothetical protein
LLKFDGYRLALLPERLKLNSAEDVHTGSPLGTTRPDGSVLAPNARGRYRARTLPGCIRDAAISPACPQVSLEVGSMRGRTRQLAAPTKRCRFPGQSDKHYTFDNLSSRSNSDARRRCKSR